MRAAGFALRATAMGNQASRRLRSTTPSQSVGVSSGNPCVSRDLSHCALRSPNYSDAGTAAHTEGRWSWMVQRL